MKPPVLEPIKPVAQCGACDQDIYRTDADCATSTRRRDCPLREVDLVQLSDEQERAKNYCWVPVYFAHEDEFRWVGGSLEGLSSITTLGDPPEMAAQQGVDQLGWCLQFFPKKDKK